MIRWPLAHATGLFAVAALFAATAVLPPVAFAQWVEFVEETALRLDLNTVAGNDAAEKDIARGDLNRDGRDDLVVVRKRPFSNPGTRTDLLLMNEGGVLVDRTAELAPAFLTFLTDARDVVIADFTGDGWPDVVIANTFHQQPQFYRNRAESPFGDWLGLQRETAARFPTLAPPGQNPGPGPLFCGVAFGDVENDRDLDLYFANYNPGGSATEDVLLINNGIGQFTNETTSRLGTYANVAFGTGAQIVDVNQDGFADIVKISTLFDVPPWNAIGVFLMFNDGTGVFDNLPFQNIPGSQEYMLGLEHLNADTLLDVYLVQDQQDRVVSATEVNPDGTLDWAPRNLSSSPRTASFGGNIRFGDVDNDGDLDLGVAPVDVDIQNCTGGSAGEFALLENDGNGGLTDPWVGDQNIHLRPHDFELIDLDGDGCLDIFMGLCTGYAVLRQDNCNSAVDVALPAAGQAALAIRAEPNPARGVARLALSVPAGVGEASVRIYDVRGSLVADLWAGAADGAPEALVWDGRLEGGAPAPAGVYWARVEAAGAARDGKIVLVR